MYKKLQGKNGLKVVVSPMNHMSSVSLGLWIGTGGRHESAKENGISHLVEHMIFKGTLTRGAKDLKQAIEGVGGAFNGFTSDEVTCYMVKVPAKYMELGMEVLSDMVINPKFDKGDLAREKFVVSEEIKMYHDQPADRVLDMLAGIMWPGNSLGRPLTGTIKTVKSLTTSDLIRYQKKNYHPANISIIASGRVDPRKVFRCASRMFSDQKRGERPTFKSPKVRQKTPRIKIQSGKNKQAHIAIGFHDEARSPREKFTSKLMNVILGGNMSSRLFEELREKYGLCYDISSSYKGYSDTAEIQIHAGVDNTRSVEATVAILDELKKLRDVGITIDELDRAKRYVTGQFLLAMEGTSSRMMWLGDRLMVHRHIPSEKEVLKRIREITAADVQKAAKRLFRSSMVNLAMVGKASEKDRNRIEKELHKL